MADLACPLLGPDTGGALRAAGRETDAPLNHRRHWSPRADWTLTDRWGVLPPSAVARQLGRSEAAVLRRLDKTGGRSVLRNQLGVTKAAAIAGCSVQYLARLCRQGVIRARKTGRRWILDDDDFHERWLTAWEARHGDA